MKAILYHSRVELERIYLTFFNPPYKYKLYSCFTPGSYLTIVCLQNCVIMTFNAFTRFFFFFFFDSHLNESNHLLPPLLPLDFTQMNAHFYNHKFRVFQSLLSLQNWLESFFFSLFSFLLDFHNIYTKTFILNSIVLVMPSHSIEFLPHRESQEHKMGYPMTLHSLF